MPTKDVTIVPVRFTKEQLKVIDSFARQLGLTRSACIRSVTLKAARDAGFAPRDDARDKPSR